MGEKAFDLYFDEDDHYRSVYSRDGTYVLCYGSRGYVSSLNVQNMTDSFEKNFDDFIRCGTYLHNENNIAISQKKNLFIYNNSGVEVHCVREIKESNKLEFLPYHFLLACVNKKGITYLDTSIGKIVSKIDCRNEEIVGSMDGVIYLGHNDGTVTLHAPIQDEYLMKIKTGNDLVDIATSYNYLYTSTSNSIKQFDLRNYFKELKTIKKSGGKLATTSKEYISTYRNKNIDVFDTKLNLIHNTKLAESINSVSFNSFEDICVATTRKRVKFLLFPGTADVNFDTREISPFLTKKQKQEREVKMLLEKIPPEMISYNSEVFSNFN
ncbi:WDR46 [Hepatospora eriocheir]|uniref:WDR46 n=1 Tax=Hepatospora eriocheir TaxID=1081669 RepID=A0A1X0QBS6_9MICR|nr:WDR46 [Hepatospora eriocheir]